MSSPQPNASSRGLVPALALLLTWVGLLTLPLWFSSKLPTRTAEPDLWHWVLLLAGGGWLLGSLGGFPERKTDSARSPLSTVYVPPPPPPAETLSKASNEQLYRALSRLNQAALTRKAPSDTSPPLT